MSMRTKATNNTSRPMMSMEAGSSAKKRRVEDEEDQRGKVLLASLRKLSDAMNETVAETRSEFEVARSPGELEKFINNPSGAVGRKGMRNLWSHVASYEACLRANDVETYSELERLWKGAYGSREVRDAVEDLLQAEERHATLVKDIERDFLEIQNGGHSLELKLTGDVVPGELKVTDASSKDIREIRSYWEGSKVTLFVLMRHFG